MFLSSFPCNELLRPYSVIESRRPQGDRWSERTRRIFNRKNKKMCRSGKEKQKKNNATVNDCSTQWIARWPYIHWLHLIKTEGKRETAERGDIIETEAPRCWSTLSGRVLVWERESSAPHAISNDTGEPSLDYRAIDIIIIIATRRSNWRTGTKCRTRTAGPGDGLWQSRDNFFLNSFPHFQRPPLVILFREPSLYMMKFNFITILIHMNCVSRRAYIVDGIGNIPWSAIGRDGNHLVGRLYFTNDTSVVDNITFQSGMVTGFFSLLLPTHPMMAVDIGVECST